MTEPVAVPDSLAAPTFVPAQPAEPPDAPTGRYILLIGLVLVAFVATIVSLIGLFEPSEATTVIGAGAEALPFVLLAVLAYAGMRRDWAKVLALGWLAVVVLGLTSISLGLSAFVVTETTPEGGFLEFVEGGLLKIALVSSGLMLAVLAGAVGFIPAVRRAASRLIAIEPGSFVHTVALVAIVAIMLSCFVPLIVLGDPPLLTLIEQGRFGSAGESGEVANATELRTNVYALLWLIPGTMLAVGLGLRRSLSATLTRLGLIRPSNRQVVLAVALSIGLVVAVTGLESGIDWFWRLMGWRTTNSEAFGELFKAFMSPIGAVVVGVTAGLGEELTVRGVLQPRLGIVLSNLFFTGMHAFQYNWDALLVVFTIGLVLGFLRSRTNTTTSAIVHGLYDFWVTILVLLEVPFFF